MLRLYEGQLIASKYRLLQPLAKGGMGSVWTGKHITLNLALLLRDLGRPIDTLDVLDELKNDFPVISPENEATAQKLRQDLEKVVGTAIWDGDYPGAAIFIDGTIRLTIGMHGAKVELAGYRPLETSFLVESQKTTTVAVALAPAHGPPPKLRPKLANQTLRFQAALGLSPTLGGQVTECEECGGGPGLGAMVMVGYRHLLVSPVRLGAIGGYAFLWQHRSGFVFFTEPPPIAVEDDLLTHAFFAAPQISAEFYAADQRFEISFALGVVGGPLINLRNGSAFELDVPSMPSASFVGVLTYLQGSWHSPWSFLGKWPMQITLGIMGIAPIPRPTYEETFTLNGQQQRFGDKLIGSFPLTFMPGIALEYDL